jgi:tight adherence protein C
VSGSALLDGSLAALGLAMAILVLTVLPARAAPRGVAGALAAIEERYAQRDLSAARKDASPTALPGWLRTLALRLSPAGIAGTLQRRLDLAGNPPAWSADRILAAKGLLLLVLGALGGLYGLLHGVALCILCAALGGAIGFFLPDVLLYNAGTKRQAKIQAALPDALDMLTVCVEAGLGFDAALAQVARYTRGPLAAEFARALQEMQIGVARAQALRGMVARTSVAELRAFVSAIVQATELGITVAGVLREQANEMRVRRRQRAEEQAQKVPIKILFPLIFCLFPALFVIILGPGAITAARVLFGV